jgi:hypothetical protein
MSGPGYHSDLCSAVGEETTVTEEVDRFTQTIFAIIEQVDSSQPDEHSLYGIH